jgi:hypothetical protein
MTKVDVADWLREKSEQEVNLVTVSGKALLAVSLIPIGVALHEHGVLEGSRAARGVLLNNVDQLRENGVLFYKMYEIWSQIAQFGQSALNRAEASELSAGGLAVSGAILWVLGKFTEIKDLKMKKSTDVLPWIANLLDPQKKMVKEPIAA